jgi:hypothetical protein
MSANTAAMSTVQAPVLGMPPKTDECKETAKKRDEQKKKGPDTAWGKSGVHPGNHRSAFKDTATAMKCVIYIRQTKNDCKDWIAGKHQPKPHACITGTTITDNKLAMAWIEAQDQAGKLDKSIYNLPSYVGIIGVARATTRIKIKETDSEGKEHEREIEVPTAVEPLRATDDLVQEECDYHGKWMTADYDLFQVLGSGGGCAVMLQSAPDFNTLLMKVNAGCGWDAIQHGPQAQWVPNEKDRAVGVKKFNMNKLVHNVLKGNLPTNYDILFHPARKRMKVIDEPMTVVAGDGVVMLEDQQAAADALKCQECGK